MVCCGSSVAAKSPNAKAPSSNSQIIKVADGDKILIIEVTDKLEEKGGYVWPTVVPTDSELVDNLLIEPQPRVVARDVKDFGLAKLVVAIFCVAVECFWIVYAQYILKITLESAHKTPKTMLVGISISLSFCAFGWSTPALYDWCLNFFCLLN